MVSSDDFEWWFRVMISIGSYSIDDIEGEIDATSDLQKLERVGLKR